MSTKEIVNVGGIDVTIQNVDSHKYISLTDIAKKKNSEEPRFVVINWLRTKSTIEFLGLWEEINNSVFKGVEFDSFLKQAGFSLTSAFNQLIII